jgi:hypothetical protein
VICEPYFESQPHHTTIRFRHWLEGDEYDEDEWDDEYDDYEDEDQEMTRDRAYGERTFAFDRWFPEGDRIYLPFETSATEGEEFEGDNDIKKNDQSVISRVEEFKGGGKFPESEDGYEVVDYVKGLAAPKSITVDALDTPEKLRAHLQSKGLPPEKIEKSVANKFGMTEGERNLFRISLILKAIAKHDQAELDQQFSNGEISQRNYEAKQSQHSKYLEEDIQWFEMSPTRVGSRGGQKKTYMVVISKKPEDLEYMTTNRSWESCMRLGNKDNEIYCEVRDGGFIAYLTDPDDKDLKNPKSRVLIRRFTSKENTNNSVAMVEDSVYGWEVPGFVDFVKRWVESKQGKINPGFYSMQGNQESDTFGDEELVTPEGMDDLWKWIEEWEQGGSETHGQAALGKLLAVDKDNPLDEESAKRLYDLAKTLNRFSFSSGDGNMKTLVKNHPDLATDEDLGGFSNYERKDIYGKLPPERQAIMRKQVYQNFMANFDYPSPLMKPDHKGVSPHGGSDYDILNLYNNMLEELEIFQPIPDPLVKKMVGLAKALQPQPLTQAMNVKYAGVGPTGKTWKDGELEERILSQVAHVLSMTHTDSPAAIEFFRNHLTNRGEQGFDFANQSGYNSWGGAVGGLGAQGGEFVDQLNTELQRTIAQLAQAEKQLAANPTHSVMSFGGPPDKRFEIQSLIRRLKQSEEEYRHAIDSITSGTGRSTKYYPH